MNFIYECAVVIYTLIRSFLSTGNIDPGANSKILKENGKWKSAGPQVVG